MLGLVLLIPSVVFASVIVGESLEEMTHASMRIVRGFVANTEARVDALTGNIFTYVDFEVVEALKGEQSNMLRLRISGGTIGGISQEVVGSARFEVGQETVVFLDPSNEPETWLVRSMSAGKVDFHRNHTGQRQAKRQLDGLSFVMRDSTAIGNQPNEDLGAADVFLAKIRLLVSAQ